VTLALLWQKYRASEPDGYGYSRFCDLYGEWRCGITATMRQTHAAGEKLFVDFAGDTVPVFDAVTGEARESKIFVAVLGASNYTYAEARFSEALPEWICAHVNTFAFLGGVPKAISSRWHAPMVRLASTACRRGLDIGAASYRSIASILKTGLDKAFLPEAAAEAGPIVHGNIRGQGYYH